MFLSTYENRLDKKGTDTLPFLSNLFSYVDKNIKHKSLYSHIMGIYGILWVLELKVNTYYLGTIIVLVIMKIDTST